MSNLRNIQFLRNSTIYANLNAAKAGLSGQVSTLLDGSPIIGRYTYEDASGNTSVKSVIGIAHKNFNNESNVTFFESANDVADAIAKLQAEMDATQAAVGTDENGNHIASSSHYTSASTTVEDEIAALAAALEAMNYTGYTLGDSEVFATITEEEGIISATGKNISGIKLAGYEVGDDNSAKVADTDTLGEALGKLQGQINGMDKAADAVDGKVVTTVTEVDGKVTETKANVKDLQLGGYVKGSETGAIASADTINVALSKIENTITANKIVNADGSINVTTGANSTDINVNIKSGEHVLAKDGNAGLYTNIALSSITPSSTTVKEEYQLTATDGTKLGDTIKIYKDSSIVTIELVDEDPTQEPVKTGQFLKYTYVDVNGDTQAVYVDVSALLVEAEFASGVTANAAGVVTGVVDSASEKVITAYSESGDTEADVFTVGEDGFKVANIQAAINAAVGKAQTTISTAVTSTDEREAHMSIAEIVADDGSKSYAFTTFDIASEDELDAEVTRAKAAEAALDAVLGSTKAIDGETRTWDVSGNAYAKGPSANADIKALDDALEELSGQTLTEMTSSNNSISGTITTATDGTKTIDLITDASKISGLTAVSDENYGAAKLSGVTAENSVQVGIKNLYDSLKSEIEARKAAISGRTVTGSNAITVTNGTIDGDGYDSTVSLKLDSTTTGTGAELNTGNKNALTITSDGLFLSNTWNCGEF